MNMYYYLVLSYPVSYYVYPITHPVMYVVYVVYVLYYTVFGLQYSEKHASHQGRSQHIRLISQIVPAQIVDLYWPDIIRIYPTANACLLPDPVINLYPIPFDDLQLGNACTNQNCYNDPCTIGILDLCLRNYYFSSVLTLGVYKPESVRVPMRGVMIHPV
jgi:hypothetical protein